MTQVNEYYIKGFGLDPSRALLMDCCWVWWRGAAMGEVCICFAGIELTCVCVCVLEKKKEPYRVQNKCSRGEEDSWM